MSRGIAAATSHRRYGAIDTVPDVIIVDSSNIIELVQECEKVANKIHLINNNTRKLEIDVRKIGTATDNQNLRNNVQMTQVKCNDLVKQTMNDLKIIGDTSRSADKQTRLQVERLQEEMRTALVAYTTIQKQVADKTKQHVLQPVSPTDDADEFHLREQEAAYNQQQRQLQIELEFEGGMLADRLTSIRGVQAEILDINVLMRMLASTVHEQAPMIDTIEQNTENTLANVETANEELIKAATHVGRRRRTVFCIALVAAVVAVIVLIILLTK